MGPAQRSALRPSLGLLGEPDGWRFRPLGMTRGVGRRRMVVRPRQRGEDRCGWRARARNRQRAGCGPRGPRPPFSEAQGQHGNGLGICLALLAPAPATRSRHSGAVRQPGEARDGAAGEVVGEGAVSGANRKAARDSDAERSRSGNVPTSSNVENDRKVEMLPKKIKTCYVLQKNSGDCRDSNPGPLRPKRGIIPLDHNPLQRKQERNSYCL